MRRFEKYGLVGCRNSYFFEESGKKMTIDDFIKYCEEEIATSPRIASINTIEELEKAYNDHYVDFIKKHHTLPLSYEFKCYLMEDLGKENN